MTKRILLPILSVSAMVLPMAPVAQAPGAVPAKSHYGVMYFNTNVGSYKILGPGETKAEGTLTMNVNGSVLISGLEGTVQTNLRRELVKEDLDKQVYFGQGKMVINGKFSAIQFFGRDLRSVWNGFGIIRLYGEFDRNLDTGEYWYAGNTQKKFWGNGGMTLTNPEAKQTRSSGSGRPGGPRVRDK